MSKVDEELNIMMEIFTEKREILIKKAKKNRIFVLSLVVISGSISLSSTIINALTESGFFLTADQCRVITIFLSTIVAFISIITSNILKEKDIQNMFEGAAKFAEMRHEVIIVMTQTDQSEQEKNNLLKEIFNKYNETFKYDSLIGEPVSKRIRRQIKNDQKAK